HRQRQRDDADDHAGHDVGQPVVAPEQPRARGFERRDHSPSPDLSRTPRPPATLAAFSPISSTPASSSAATTLVSESTIPRTLPLLASIRWMVGSDTPDRRARVRWSIPSNARAARICAAVIIVRYPLWICNLMF